MKRIFILFSFCLGFLQIHAQYTWDRSQVGTIGSQQQNSAYQVTTAVNAYDGANFQNSAYNGNSGFLHPDLHTLPPVIHSITDVPNDQGKQVQVVWNKSDYDESYSPNRFYSLWRQDETDGILSEIVLNPYEVIQSQSSSLKEFFCLLDGEVWTYIDTIPALNYSQYSSVAPTLFDSVAGTTGFSNFKVVFHDLFAYYESQADSGYSVDNLAPQTPNDFMGFAMNEQLHFNWSEPMDEDFQYFAAYKSDPSGEFPELPFQTTITNGISNGINVDDHDYMVTAFDFNGNESNASEVISAQSIQLITGWEGISTYIAPSYPEVESMFNVLSDELILLQNMTGIYWPAQNINTLGNWDDNSGYYLKTNAESTLAVIGPKVSETALQISEGWNLIPVLSTCQTDVAGLFEGQDAIIVKEVAGTNLYWPEMNINTLGYLQPGKAYFVLMQTAGEISFPECISEMKFIPEKSSETSVLLKAYNVVTTPNSHIIAFDASVIIDFEDLESWVITACDADGHCFGAGYPADNSISIFGDDPTTIEKDGFKENELLQIIVVNAKTGDRYSCEVDYDFRYPNHDGLFEKNGLSVISNLKLSSQIIDEFHLSSISIYPNPANDEVTIQSGFEGDLNIEIIDQLGNVLISKQIATTNQKLDVSTFAPGVYLITLKTKDRMEIRKLVVR